MSLFSLSFLRMTNGSTNDPLENTSCSLSFELRLGVDALDKPWASNASKFSLSRLPLKSCTLLCARCREPGLGVFDLGDKFDGIGKWVCARARGWRVGVPLMPVFDPDEGREPGGGESERRPIVIEVRPMRSMS